MNQRAEGFWNGETARQNWVETAAAALPLPSMEVETLG